MTESMASMADPQTGKRAASDEAYVVELCEQILGQKAVRQARFAWLLGDPNSLGRRARLPVDACWPHLHLVVGYRERQHTDGVPFFDRRHTVSGVGRREQRRRYDELREELPPAHGVRLVVVPVAALSHDGRGRLLRDADADRRVLRGLLAVE